jgi:hypothetical protein
MRTSSGIYVEIEIQQDDLDHLRLLTQDHKIQPLVSLRPLKPLYYQCVISQIICQPTPQAGQGQRPGEASSNDRRRRASLDDMDDAPYIIFENL